MMSLNSEGWKKTFGTSGLEASDDFETRMAFGVLSRTVKTATLYRISVKGDSKNDNLPFILKLILEMCRIRI